METKKVASSFFQHLKDCGPWELFKGKREWSKITFDKEIKTECWVHYKG